jgi:UDPglucose--hexose-1-phosphate uridylyltransferase
MSELRKDPVIGRWVIISPERGLRPHDFEYHEGSSASRKCPFCAGNEAKHRLRFTRCARALLPTGRAGR